MKNKKFAYLDAFKVQKILMILTGMWPREDLGMAYKLYGFFMSFALQAAFLMPSLFFVINMSTDMGHGSYILFSTLTTTAYGIKYLVLYHKRYLFNEILKDLEQPMFTSYSNKFAIYMNNAVALSVGIRKLIHLPCVIFIIFIAVFPSLDKDPSQSLPYSYPVNVEELSTFVYVLVYCLEILAAAICACNNGNFDTLMCSFMALGVAQLEILGAEMKNLAEVCDKHRAFQDDPNDSMLEDVNKCVQHHMAVAEYVEKLENLFKMPCLAQFVCSIAVIGIVGFSFIIIPVTDIMFGACLSYFGAAMVEITIYCIFGDELIIHSTKIQDACYMSEWVTCGPKTKKSLLIIMERSKRPLVLTAGKFATLSRESLIGIYRSAFSYYAVLRKLYVDE